MESFRQELWFELPSQTGFVNVTPKAERPTRQVSSLRIKSNVYE